MGLEAVTYISDLVGSNPVSGDSMTQGDDHLRNIKIALQNTFPGLSEAVTIGSTDTPQFAGIEIGHATDTTLARASAGDLSVEGNLIYRVGGANVAIADGGTGESTAPAALAALGGAPAIGSTSITTLGTIGTGVWNATTIALANGGTGATTPAGARTALELGSMALQAAGAVAITGGSITGIGDLAIADGGTGQSTAPAAFAALKQPASTTTTGVVEKSTSAENVAGTAPDVFPDVVGVKEMIDTHGTGSPPSASTTVEGVVELATTTEFRVGTDTTRAITPSNVLDAAAWVTLTDAATPAVDHAAGVNRAITIAGNRTMGAPTNVKPGYPLNFRIKQDATGGWTMAWHANYDFGDAGAPTLSTAANAEDLVTFLAITATKFVFLGIRKRID